jgi:hypothetical protein
MRIICSLLCVSWQNWTQNLLKRVQHTVLSGRLVMWIREFSCFGHLCLSSSFCPPMSVLQCLLSLLRPCLLCICINSSSWSWSVDFHRKLCFWYAVHSAGSLLCLWWEWPGMAACCCSSLPQFTWMILPCALCQLHSFCTTTLSKPLTQGDV